MSHITRDTYVSEARQLDAMQSEAERRRDKPAMIFIQQRKVDLHRAFWGRDMKLAR